MADATTRLTATGTVLGTPNYMAPEQFEGSPVGPAADLWALGATMFTMLTGRHVHEAPSNQEQLVLSASTPAPSLARPSPPPTPPIKGLVSLGALSARATPPAAR